MSFSTFVAARTASRYAASPNLAFSPEADEQHALGLDPVYRRAAAASSRACRRGRLARARAAMRRDLRDRQVVSARVNSCVPFAPL
jgi:hypothetical protein